jgi:hypothetical protein
MWFGRLVQSGTTSTCSCASYLAIRGLYRVQELITDFLGMPSVYSEAQGSAGGTQYAVIHSM